MEYCPLGKKILRQCETNYVNYSPGLNVRSRFDSCKRALGDAILTWHMMESLTTKLEAKNYMLKSLFEGATHICKITLCGTFSSSLCTFSDIEMGVMPILASMELGGIGLNATALRELSVIMQGQMTQLQDRVWALAGKKFNFYSPKEVSQVNILKTD